MFEFYNYLDIYITFIYILIMTDFKYRLYADLNNAQLIAAVFALESG